MPKIIENLQLRLITEARRQIEAEGYSAVTIRSVANACSVGVGTVYNYFSSKDALLAAYMLDDWKVCVEAIAAAGNTAVDAKPVLAVMHDQLLAFSKKHDVVFRDEAAAANFSGSFSKYHAVLRDQLAEPLRKFCADDFTAQFTAEAMRTWTMEGKVFEEIYGILSRLL